jgi:hypothetical protein
MHTSNKALGGLVKEMKGREILAAQKISMHEDDWFLWLVLYRRDNSHTPYVVHTWNGQSGGLCHGHYFSDPWAAFRCFHDLAASVYSYEARPVDLLERYLRRNIREAVTIAIQSLRGGPVDESKRSKIRSIAGS